MSSFISCSPFDFSLAEGAAFEADALAGTHCLADRPRTFRVHLPWGSDEI